MKKVILVDDEAVAISRLRHMLNGFTDIQVIGDSHNSEDAVCQIIKQKPDLVFLDVELRESTGFTVIEKVRAQGGRCRFIIISGYAHYAIASIRHRVDDYLLKPVDQMELRAAIDRLDSHSDEGEMESSLAITAGLSPRERLVLTGLLAGKTSREMAQELNLSPHTIDTFRRKILRKMNVKNTMELIKSTYH